jgi:hypothetical protein
MTLLALRSKSKALYFRALESSAKKPRRYSHSPRITISCWRARSGCRSGTDADRVSAGGAQTQPEDLPLSRTSRSVPVRARPAFLRAGAAPARLSPRRAPIRGTPTELRACAARGAAAGIRITHQLARVGEIGHELAQELERLLRGMAPYVVRRDRVPVEALCVTRVLIHIRSSAHVLEASACRHGAVPGQSMSSVK